MDVSIRFLNQNPYFDMREAAMNTVNKQAGEDDEINHEIFKKYIISEHSPIRSVILRIKIYDIPYPQMVHFVRHIHTLHFVSTNRPDRTKKERSINDTCVHIMDCNIQALLDMARKRLCIGKCQKETYEIMLAIKKKLINMGWLYKIIGENMVPNCYYRGSCAEFVPCGFYINNGEEMNERYIEYNERTV